MPTPRKVKFSIGDIIVDEKNSEIGVLIEKYKLVEQEQFFGKAFTDFDFWVWEVYFLARKAETCYILCRRYRY